MGRLLLIIGIFFLVWIGYRFLKNTWSARIKAVEDQQQKTPSQQNKIQQIRACSYCKTHIPEDEGITKDGRFFCSYQHLDSYLEHNKNNQ